MLFFWYSLDHRRRIGSGLNFSSGGRRFAKLAFPRIRGRGMYRTLGITSFRYRDGGGLVHRQFSSQWSSP